MLALKTKTIFASFFVLALLNTAATCQTHTVRNVRVCTVAGVLSAGMDCGNTRSDVVEEMTLDETIEFLEPQAGKDGKPDRAGAMCLHADDYTKSKDDLEILCRLMGKRCDFEEVKKVTNRLGTMQQKALVKKIAATKPKAPPKKTQIKN